MMMDPSDFRQLLHRYQQGRCTPAEKQRVEAWYNNLAPEQPLHLTPSEKDTLVATVWQRIARQTAIVFPPATDANAQHAAPLVGLRWAAVALLALGAGLTGIYSGQIPARWATAGVAQPRPAWLVYSNASGYDARVVLPDGSAVTLAPASSLKYPPTFRGKRRTVYLTGAAFFDVFHDANHPFSVYTARVVTTVLGTSFRVQAYAGQADVQVQVRTGAVRVTPRDAAASPAPAAAGLVVLPNQQAVYSGAQRQFRRELVAQPALLTPQAFVFRDRPVAEVLTALVKAYGVAIEYDATALRSCTLNLSLGQEPLFDKLNIICETLGATYEQADGRILFHSQPCLAE